MQTFSLFFCCPLPMAGKRPPRLGWTQTELTAMNNLRAEGKSWKQIEEAFSSSEGCNPRTAAALQQRYSRRKVAKRKRSSIDRIPKLKRRRRDTENCTFSVAGSCRHCKQQKADADGYCSLCRNKLIVSRKSGSDGSARHSSSHNKLRFIYI